MHETKQSTQPIFSLKFSLALISLSLLMPLVLALPLLTAQQLDYPLVDAIGLNSGNFYMFVLASQAISLTLSIFFISKKLRKQGEGWQLVGIGPFQIGRSLKYIIGYYLLIIGLLLPVLLGLALATQGADIPSATDSATAAERFGSLVPALIISVFLAPVIEEILFRGVLFTTLRQKKGLLFAIVVGGIIFSLAHIGNPVQALGALPLDIS